MVDRREDEQGPHPREIQDFIDWGERQYLDGVVYHGGRLPPIGVLVAGAWATAATLLLVGSLQLLGILIAGVNGGTQGRSTVPGGRAVPIDPVEFVYSVGMLLVGAWIAWRLRRRDRVRRSERAGALTGTATTRRSGRASASGTARRRWRRPPG